MYNSTRPLFRPFAVDVESRTPFEDLDLVFPSSERSLKNKTNMTIPCNGDAISDGWWLSISHAFAISLSEL